jgi:hypothetical protein
MALKTIIGTFILCTMLFLGCEDSAQNKSATIDPKGKICPQCNMPLSASSHEHVSYAKEGSDVVYFDDPGCMILWMEEQNKPMNDLSLFIYSNDTFTYIDAKKAFYTQDDITPMNYGFAAYMKKGESMVTFKQMRLKMLRGEHLGNPKIRKQILGY